MICCVHISCTLQPTTNERKIKMRYQKITIKNEFHNTVTYARATVKPRVDWHGTEYAEYLLSDNQHRKIADKLCGIRGCQCRQPGVYLADGTELRCNGGYDECSAYIVR